MDVTLAEAAFLAMMGAWYVIRLPHLLRSRRTPVALSRRSGLERCLMAVSGAGMGLVPLAYVAFGFGGVGERADHPAATILGIGLGLVALLLFQLSHAGLGRQWSVSLELREAHRLRTDGIYRYVRHPMYAAFWIWCAAQALLLPNWIAGLSGLVGFGCLYAFRVPREERMMLEHYGEAYRAYAAKTPALIPNPKTGSAP